LQAGVELYIFPDLDTQGDTTMQSLDFSPQVFFNRLVSEKIGNKLKYDEI